ncbi:MAG: hypothetical protein HS108_03355 [Planctomycetes bacterium]|jgi:hypothetical protein|nr:hypothetical protein [Planctomycetota bacterium]MCL4730363.1 hypothetical protein [Planctomycetota bacterium]
MRTLLIALVLFAPLLAAQDSFAVSGSVPGNRRLTYLIRADFGPAAVSFSLAASVSTPSSQGIIVRLMDLDAVAGSGALNPPGFDESVVPGAGTANATLSGSYAGRREFVLEIESAGAGSSFSGNVTSSAGTLELPAQEQLVLSATGLRFAVGRMAFFNATTTPGAVVAAGFQVDLGPVPRTVFIRLDCAGTNLNRMELVETTGGSATILATITQAAMPDAVSVALSGSGKRTLRVNARGAAGFAGSAAWAVTAPTDTLLARVDNTDSNEDDNEGRCAAVPGAPWPPAAAVLALAALWRRRRAAAP